MDQGTTVRTSSVSIMALLGLVLLMSVVASASRSPGTTGAGRWESSGPMLVAKDDFGTAVIHERFYALGGMTGPEGRPLDDAQVFDLDAQTWMALPALTFPRRSLRAAAIDSSIYVVGGATATGLLATVEVFDTTTHTWATRASLPSPRQGVGLIAIGNRILAIGGYGPNHQFISDVNEYDPVTNTWQPRAPMPTPRSHFSLVLLDDRVYAIGGGNDSGPLAIVEVYDPMTDTWSTAAPLAEPLRNFGAVVVDGVIHILHHDLHVTYSPVSGSQVTLPAMPSSRHGMGVAVVAGDIYAFGGCHEFLYDLAVTERWSAAPQ